MALFSFGALIASSSAEDDATMPTNGNEMMLERFDRVETRLAGVEVRLDRVETRLAGVEVRLDRVETRVAGVEVRLDRVETRVAGVEIRLGRVETRLDGVETKVDGLTTKMNGLTTEVKELGTRVGRVEVQLEDMRDTLHKFTNTMSARFDAIDRRLEEDHKQFAAKFLDQDLVLTNHNRRITALERRPRRRT